MTGVQTCALPISGKVEITIPDLDVSETRSVTKKEEVFTLNIPERHKNKLIYQVCVRSTPAPSSSVFLNYAHIE